MFPQTKLSELATPDEFWTWNCKFVKASTCYSNINCKLIFLLQLGLRTCKLQRIKSQAMLHRCASGLSCEPLALPFICRLPPMLGRRAPIPPSLHHSGLLVQTAWPQRWPDEANKQVFVRSTNHILLARGKVKVDLIFCLVLIKQLLHYLISYNRVKEEEKSGGKGWSRGRALIILCSPRD